MVDTALENPITKFPKPPFKRQTQPWPGLAGKMEPRPDHGEKSYKGSGRAGLRNRAKLPVKLKLRQVALVRRRSGKNA